MSEGMPRPKVEKYEFQPDIQAMVKDLDDLRQLLDPEFFRPDFSGPPLATRDTATHLNALTGNIGAYGDVISKLDQQEYDALMSRIQAVENEIPAAIEKTKSEGVPGFVQERTLLLLEKETPALLEKLRNLKSKVG